jgi:hypothetical protein
MLGLQEKWMRRAGRISNHEKFVLWPASWQLGPPSRFRADVVGLDLDPSPSPGHLASAPSHAIEAIRIGED